MAGQLWGTSNLGGYLSSAKLSKMLRQAVQPQVKFRQACDVKDASLGGLKKGSTFQWDTVSNVATSGGVLSETAAVPETNVVIGQSSLTVDEYGIAIPFTEKLENMSEIAIKPFITQALRNDAVKTLDRAAHAQFDATPLRVAPTGGTSATAVSLSTTGSTAVVNDVALTKAHVNAIALLMQERDIPAYAGDDYLAIGRPTTFAPFKLELESVHQYTESGMGKIMNGELGRYDGVRFVKQTNIAAEAWANGKSDAVFFMGEGTVAEAVVIPEEIRGGLPTDFGRKRGLMWFYCGGFGLDQTAAAQARVVKWDSAS